jgi:uncharacterized protein (TIGR03067 family)
MATQSNKLKLSGRWRAVYSELDGEMTPVAHFSTIVMTFERGKFKIESDGKLKHEGTYIIDAKTDPAKIIYTYSRSDFFKEGQKRKGIIQLTNDTMKESVSAVGKSAPRSFNSTKGSDAVFTIHQRVGKERGTGLPVSKTKIVSQW